MSKILIAAWSKPKNLDGNLIRNSKDYPYWDTLIKKIKTSYSDAEVIQIYTEGTPRLKSCDKHIINPTLKEVGGLLKECDTFISVDSFLPHMAANLGIYGFVIWGPSSPEYFGYEENVNIQKSGLILREETWATWSLEPIDNSKFLTASKVFKIFDKNYDG